MFGWIILAIVVAFLAVILIRAALFTPKDAGQTEFEPVDFDRDAAVASLAELIKCRTVSYNDSSLEDDAEFESSFPSFPCSSPTL